MRDNSFLFGEMACGNSAENHELMRKFRSENCYGNSALLMPNENL